MLAPSERLKCRVCNTAAVTQFLELDDLPLFCNVLWPTRAEALGAAKGVLRLGVCNECGHIFNYAFQPELMEYSQGYENTLHFSPHFQDFTEQLARHLIDTYAIRNKEVVDIGCGKGDFLATLCEIGDNSGIGFDRSYSPEGAAHSTRPNLRFVQEYFSEQSSTGDGDLICCRHVLEHIDRPKEFLRGIRSGVRNEAAVYYFEVPNVMYTLRDLGVWDLIYEHCSYFSSTSIEYLFVTSGFCVSRVSELYDGQFIGIECTAGQKADALLESSDHVAELQANASSFGAKYRSRKETWEAKLDDLACAGKRVVVWGGGSKGVTFLNVLGSQQIAYVVDINPRKHGKYVAGTGQKVVPPGFLTEYKPDVVIVMNEVYTREIGAQLAHLGLSPVLLSS